VQAPEIGLSNEMFCCPVRQAEKKKKKKPKKKKKKTIKIC
jgi:hypothetical protein